MRLTQKPWGLDHLIVCIQITANASKNEANYHRVGSNMGPDFFATKHLAYKFGAKAPKNKANYHRVGSNMGPGLFCDKTSCVQIWYKSSQK